MGEDFEEGAPFFFATQRPPTAMAQDDDIFLTVTAAVPTFPGQVEDIDIILSIEYAQRAIAQLQQAVDLALRSEAPRGRESPGGAGSVPQSLPGATAPVSLTRNPIDQLGLSFPTVAKRPIGNPD
jgi:hypothetical protein